MEKSNVNNLNGIPNFGQGEEVIIPEEVIPETPTIEEEPVVKKKKK